LSFLAIHQKVLAIRFGQNLNQINIETAIRQRRGMVGRRKDAAG
jgi:hypothetical protein